MLVPLCLTSFTLHIFEIHHVLACISKVCSFLSPTSVSLYAYAPGDLPIHQMLVDIGAVSHNGVIINKAARSILAQTLLPVYLVSLIGMESVVHAEVCV